MSRRRGALLWLALFAVYAATLGIDAGPAGDYGPGEAHVLLSVESVVSDGDVDLADEYRTQAWRPFYDGTLRPGGRLTDGRRNEPHGVGVALLAAPGYAVGGPRGAELTLAALAALAFVLAIVLARRLVPEPWATAAPLVVALSPPALASATAISPEPAAAVLLAGACLLALRARERPRLRTAALTGLLLALLPWLSLKFVPAGLVVGAALVAWLVRRRRGLAALVACEVAFTSVVTYITLNGTLFGGLTPFAADTAPGPPTGAGDAGDYLDRATRLAGLWLDRNAGVLRWAPFLALTGVSVWLLWRARRDRLAAAVPDQAEVDAAAGLLLAVLGAQAVVAALLAPTLFGPWFPGRQFAAVLPLAGALAAWGLRHAPRAGAALAALTLAGSVWLLAALRFGDEGWVMPSTPAPWGPLERLLPDFGAMTAWADAVSALALLALAGVVAWEWLRSRRPAGEPAPAP